MGVIVGLFQAISQKLPALNEWDSRKHHNLFNSNMAVCDAMTEVRDHVTRYGTLPFRFANFTLRLTLLKILTSEVGPTPPSIEKTLTVCRTNSSLNWSSEQTNPGFAPRKSSLLCSLCDHIRITLLRRSPWDTGATISTHTISCGICPALFLPYICVVSYFDSLVILVYSA